MVFGPRRKTGILEWGGEWVKSLNGPAGLSPMLIYRPAVPQFEPYGFVDGPELTGKMLQLKSEDFTGRVYVITSVAEGPRVILHTGTNISTVAARMIANICQELKKAAGKHKPINSLHEGHAVLMEEVDEFWGQVKPRSENRDTENVLTELTQIAAMAIRTAVDVHCDEILTPDRKTPGYNELIGEYGTFVDHAA